MNAYLGCLSILKLHCFLKILFQEFFTYSRHKPVSDVWLKVFSSDPCGASAWLLILRLVFFNSWYYQRQVDFRQRQRLNRIPGWNLVIINNANHPRWRTGVHDSSGSSCESFWVGTRVGLIKSVKIAVGSVETKKLVLLDFLLKCVNKVFESIGCVKQTNKQASKNPALFVLGPCHLFY